MKKVLTVFVAPYATYSYGEGEYWLNGKRIASNAESYKVDDIKLFDIFNLDVCNSHNAECERIISRGGGYFESIEEFLWSNYGLDNLNEDTNLIIVFDN